MDKKLIIIGASSHGKVVADIARLNGYTDIKFLDDDTSKKKILNYEVVGTTRDYEKYKIEYSFIIAIGNNKIRKQILGDLSLNGVTFATIIHPSAVIDSTVRIGIGSVVMANAVINADTTIGMGCIINTSSSVDHDCYIHNCVHVCPGTHIAGTVEIGEQSWIGIGSCVINNVSITDNVLIGAGGVVVKDIKEKGTYIGVPVRKSN